MESPWVIVDQRPSHGRGYYPVSLCYDPREGIIPSGELWDGDKWNSTHVLYFIDKRFDEMRDAVSTAYEHDIELK